MTVRRFWWGLLLFLVWSGLLWWFSVPVIQPDMQGLQAANRLFAFWGFGFFLAQFILSSRLPALERSMGLDNMLRYHRWMGRAALGALLIHGVLVIGLDWWIEGSISWHWGRTVGAVVLVLMMLTAGTASLYRKLNLRYEVWKGLHWINYLLFPLALPHVFFNAAPGSGEYYLWILFAATFAGLFGYRVWRWIEIRRNPYRVERVTRENSDTWSLYFSGPDLCYRPGQFAHIQLSRGGQLSESHPFTLSSSPTDAFLRITPKELGDFTRTIGDTQVGDQVYVDAPYGVFSFVGREERPLVFIAGGIGITPFMSMLRYMKDQQLAKDVVLLWANQTRESLCFQSELEEVAAELPGFRMVPVMSRDTEWSGEQGRIDFDRIRKYVENPRLCDFYLCGPPPMTRALIQALKSHGIPSGQIHHELFEM